MDSSRSLPHPLRDSAATNIVRYLPTYEETNLPYSYRLPTYRSSYIRRYHPYARYAASPPPDYLMVCIRSSFAASNACVLTCTKDGGDHIDEGAALGDDDNRLDAQAAGPAGERCEEPHPVDSERRDGIDDKQGEQNKLLDSRANQQDLFCKVVRKIVFPFVPGK